MTAIRGRLTALTGLRALAAGAVVLCHLNPPDETVPLVTTFMDAGYNGVTLFFILSGFVLTWSYSDRMRSPSTVGIASFFIARIARIYPLYLVALAFITLPRVLRSGPKPLDWIHAFALQTWLPNVNEVFTFNGVGWSIGVEFFLYACFPALVVLLVRLRTRALIAVMASSAAALGLITLWFVLTGRGALPEWDPESAHRWLYRTPLLRLPDFVVGSGLALLARRHEVRRGWSRAAQGFGVGSALILMCVPSLAWSAWSFDGLYLVPFALLIWGLATDETSALSRVLQTRALVFLGEISFAFYLLHLQVIRQIAIGPDPAYRWWIGQTVVQLAFAVMIAAAAHHLIERPAQTWLRAWIEGRLRPAVSTSTLPVLSSGPGPLGEPHPHQMAPARGQAHDKILSS